MRTYTDSSRKWLSLFGLVSAILCATSATAAIIPSISWSPNPITYPAALSSAHLNAVAKNPSTQGVISGHFDYSANSVQWNIGDKILAGDYTVTATFRPDDKVTYQDGVSQNFPFTVSRGTLSLIPVDKTKVYGGANPDLKAGAQLIGADPADNLDFILDSSGLDANAHAGDYSISGSILDPLNRGANYIVQLSTAKLKIEPRPITITPANVTVNYGDFFPNTFTGTIPLVANDVVLTATFDVKQKDGAGNPKIYSVGPDNTGNVDALPGNYPIYLSYLSIRHGGDGGLVTDPAYQNPYREFPKNDAGAYTDDLKNPNIPKLTDYKVTLQEGTLTILSRPLIFIAGSAITEYGLPAQLPDIQIQGLLGNDLGKITASYSPTLPDPNVYTLNPQPVDNTVGARLQYYSVQSIAGTLTITKADQTPKTVNVDGKDLPSGIKTPGDISITYGTLLQSGQLNAVNYKNPKSTGAVNPPALEYYFDDDGTPAKGTAANNALIKPPARKIKVVSPETPQYARAEATYWIYVTPFTPSITWYNSGEVPSIPFGQALDATRLNAEATGVANGEPVGTRVFDPPLGTFLDKRDNSPLRVLFAGNAFYNTVSKDQVVDVTKATPVLQDLIAPEIPTPTDTFIVGGKFVVPGGAPTTFTIPGAQNNNPSTESGKTTVQKVRIRIKDGSSQVGGDYFADILQDGTFSLPITGNFTKTSYDVVYSYPSTSGTFAGNRFNTVGESTSRTTKLTQGKLSIAFSGLTSEKFTYGDKTSITLKGTIRSPSGTTAFIPDGNVIITFAGTPYPASITNELGNGVGGVPGGFEAVIDVTGKNAGVYPVLYEYGSDGQFNKGSTTFNAVEITKAKLDIQFPDAYKTRYYGDARVTNDRIPASIPPGQLKFNDGNFLVAYYDSRDIGPTTPVGTRSVLSVVKFRQQVGNDDDFTPTENNDIPMPEKLANYDYTKETGFVEIRRFPVIVVPNDTTVVTNRPIPAFTYNVYDYTKFPGQLVNGLKNNETTSVLNPQPDLRTEAQNTSTADTQYRIYVTNAPSASNYEVHYAVAEGAVGYLKVVKDKPFVVLAKPADLTYGQAITGTQLNVDTVVVKGTNAIGQGAISYKLVSKTPGLNVNKDIKADEGYTPHAGEYEIQALFTPNQDTKLEAPYNVSESTNVILKVNRATLIVQPDMPSGDFVGKDITVDWNNTGTTLTNQIIPKYYGFVLNEQNRLNDPNNPILNPMPVRYFPVPVDPAQAGTYVYYYTNHFEVDDKGNPVDPMNPDYAPTFLTRQYIVKVIPVTITWDPTGSLAYPAVWKIGNAGIPAATATASDGTVFTDPKYFTYSIKDDTLLTAGEVKVSVTFNPVGQTGKYGTKTEERTINVTKATLNVQVAYYLTRSYGDPNPAFPLIPKTYAPLNLKPGLLTNAPAAGQDVTNYVVFPGSAYTNVWITGFVNGEKITDAKFANLALKTSATASSPVNGGLPYKIELSDIPNYQYNYVVDDTIIPANVSKGNAYGSITLTNAPLRNTAANISVYYGSKDIFSQLKGTLVGVKTAAGDNITATYLIKLANADHPEQAEAGLYTITPNLSDPAGRLVNYTYTPVDGTLTIMPAVLTLKADNKFKKPGMDNPKFTYTLTGFVNDQQNTDPTKAGYITFTEPSFTTTATKNSPIGQYPIVPSGASAGNNYSFNYVNGTLEVQVNRAPTALPDGMIATLGDVTKVLKEKLTINDTDPDQDKLRVISPSLTPLTTPKGGKVQADNTGLWLFYIPFDGAVNGATDSFTYTITDDFGGTAVGTVNVLIQTSTANAIPNNIVSAKMNPDGSIYMRFIGITGRKYKIQASVNFLNPTWQDLPMNTLTLNQDPTKGNVWTEDRVAPFDPGTFNPENNTLTANKVGFIEYTDIDASLFPARFYRAVLAP